MKLLRDWVWIGLWASLLGTGCASANRESAADVALAEAAPTEAELNDQLTADRLRPRQLRALEVRAQQKLRDFFDYLNLVGDPSLDSTFRAEAARQALLLFADPQASVRLAPVGHPPRTMTARQWLDELTRSDEAVAFTVGEPALSRPLTLTDSLQYRGELSVTTPVPDAEAARGKAQAYPVRVVVKRVAKDFGEDEMQVWEVFLEGVG